MYKDTLHYALSPHELRFLREYLHKRSSAKGVGSIEEKSRSNGSIRSHGHTEASVRAAMRVFVATFGGLSVWELIKTRFLSKKRNSTMVSRQSIYQTPNFRLALSLSTILFLHRTLYRFLRRLRSNLQSEKAAHLRQRYPRLFKIVSAKLLPPLGASLAGLGLGIYPADQLRLTVTIYVGARALEILYNVLEQDDYLRRVPKWVGSWMIFALAQGQLLHAFVFDRDCFPSVYANLIVNNTPGYVQRKPANMPKALLWPDTDQIVDSLADMANLKWPSV